MMGVSGSQFEPREEARTVDEIWGDIQKAKSTLGPERRVDVGSSSGTGTGSGTSSNDPQRQTYERVTVEDFLVNPGEGWNDGGLLAQQSTAYTPNLPYLGSNGAGAPDGQGNNRGEKMGPGSFAARPNCARLSLAAVHGLGAPAQQQEQFQPMISPALAPNFTGAHGLVCHGVGHGHGSGLSPSLVGNLGVGSMRVRKRGADEPADKAAQRKQERMIKNRESAARSRSRKQAYTMELEAEVLKLKEENEQLRREHENDCKRSKLVLESIDANTNSTNLGKTFQRTNSGPW